MNARASMPLVLVIFDGWGIARPGPGNAISLAKTPVMDRITRRFPSTTLAASGPAVGLPQRQEGNSEAGHMNIGAGRVVEQDAVRISKSINDGSFFKNAAFRAAIHHAVKHESTLHLMGLLTSEQSAHADPDHVIALLTLLRNSKLNRIALHFFTDGRDSPPSAAIRLLRAIERELRPNETIATVIGRFYAMDRKKMWSRTKQAYLAMVGGEGRVAKSAEEAILQAYDRGETDEFIEPTVIGSRRQHRIGPNDSVIFFNLRSDRARQLTKTFVQPNFNALNAGAFRRTTWPVNLLFVVMTDFGPDLGEIYTAFPSLDLYHTLPVVFRKFRQLYIAESEKFAHVTFFLNGGYDKPVAGEERRLIPSPDVVSYDASPAMSVEAITNVVRRDLESKKHDVIVVNFANPDMLGHTGNLQAAVIGIEVVDACVGRIHRAVHGAGGTMVVTADHGNAEDMSSADGKSVDTEHSTNRVPFSIVTPEALPIKLRTDGALADVAPTILDILAMSKPSAMTGQSLLNGG